MLVLSFLLHIIIHDLQTSKADGRKLNSKISSLEQHNATLQSEVEELRDFEELKSSFEEYQRENQAEMDEERQK